MSIELILSIPHAWWLSSNDRLHFREKANRTRAIRQYAAIEAKNARLPTFEHAAIWAFIQYPTATKADPMNAYPVCKAAVDGLVDAGAFPDDDSTHVLGPFLIRETGKAPPKTHRVRLVITDQTVPWL